MNGSPSITGSCCQERLRAPDLVALHRNMTHHELRTLMHRQHDAGDRPLILDMRLVDRCSEIALVAVIARQQLGDDKRFGEEIALELLLVDDLDEVVRVDFPEAPTNARTTFRSAARSESYRQSRGGQLNRG